MAPSTVAPTAPPPYIEARAADPLIEETREQVVVEAWGQGMNFGALIFIILIVLCNYRKNVLLHKLILIEVSLTTSPSCDGS